MRTNLPVTTTEYLLKEGESIVSTTDLKGNITDVNPCFVEVSGFTAEELLDVPRNLVQRSASKPQRHALPLAAMVRHPS
jgi:aerotaxis receptor